MMLCVGHYVDGQYMCLCCMLSLTWLGPCQPLLFRAEHCTRNVFRFSKLPMGVVYSGQWSLVADEVNGKMTQYVCGQPHTKL